jgi:hypothetical protein
VVKVGGELLVNPVCLVLTREDEEQMMDINLGDDSLSALLHLGVAPVLASRDIPITPSQSVNDFMLVLCKVMETAVFCS